MVQATFQRHRRYGLLALFAVITVGFACYRCSLFAIWNDSSCVFHPHGIDDPNDYWEELRIQFQEAPLATAAHGIQKCFLDTKSGGYRPISGLWTCLCALIFYSPSEIPFPLLLANGAILGGLAVSLFHVAGRFVRHDLTALGIVLLTLGSPPLVGSSWVCVAGVQALVPLLFCLSLLCYWNLVEGDRSILCAVVLILLLLLGPWVREFFGLNAILLLLLEFRRRRASWIGLVAALGFLHALFPTALVHFLFLPHLPLKPVYLLGTLSNQMGSGGLRWNAAWHFLPLFPPTLLVLAGVESLLRMRAGTGEINEMPRDRLGRIELVLQRLAIPIWLLALSVLLAYESRYPGCLGLTLCLVIAALGLRRDPFLGCWFLLMFMPILRVFSEHVHFLYAIPPAAIILGEAMESLWLRLKSRPVLAWMRYALSSVLALMILDQSLNIYAAYKINHTTYRGIDEVATWFVRNVPRDAAVVTNVIHGDEIKWHSGGHIEIYWTITVGIDDPRRAVDEPSQLEKLLAKRDLHPVYFLDVDFDYLPHKREYHSHKYVHQAVVESRDLGVVHRTNFRYPFADPLRYLIPRSYLPFLGAPDLENDFARNCSAHHLFGNEIAAAYHVYEVTGSKIDLKMDGEVHLAQEGIDGFNIVHLGLAYYALPQGEGAFEVQRFLAKGYSAQFSGLTLQSVRDQIKAFRKGP